MKKNILLLAAFMMTVCSSMAQTLHVINFCNTLHPEIGTVVDYERTNRESGLIASFIGYNISYYNGVGEACSKENLMTTINSLGCGKDDIILFYYSGHGTRSINDKSEYPQMCLKYEGYQQDKFVPVHTVVEMLKGKGARLTIVLTDCCNKALPGISTKSLMENDGKAVVADERIEKNYRKLFLENKGLIVSTSSKAGQYSHGWEELGGAFSIMFFESALYSACKGVIPATWEAIMASVATSIEGQTPFYELKLQNVVEATDQVTSNATTSHTQQNVTAVDASFADDLSTLLDDSQSIEWRTRQAERLNAKYFAEDAKVATVGRNGKTIIDFETSLEFLHRMATTRLIKQVLVLTEQKDATGKRNYIKVQEIRKTK
ncbi:MAG: caspase family protein [Bacteroidales bacterium]|nr:caspase family protein [Bacteroidales bacterium]